MNITATNGVELNKIIKGHQEFYTKFPVGKYNVHFTVLCECYDKSVHNAILQHLQIFCNNAKMSPAGFLEVKNLDRAEGGFQFVLKTDDSSMRNTKEESLNDFSRMWNRCTQEYPTRPGYPVRPLEKYIAESVETFEALCQVRYTDITGNYGETFGTSKLVTFAAYANCPWHIMLELFRIFDTNHVQQSELGCGKTKIIARNGIPDDNDAIWYSHTIWK